MTEDRRSPQERVRTLKSEFDRSFSDPVRDDRRDVEGFLAVRVSGDGYALRLDDIAALAVRPKLVPLPSRRPGFLGMAGHRGTLAALFSLSQLLDYGSSSAAAARWFILTRASATLGLAFEAYEGYVHVATSDIHAVAEGARRRYATRAVRQAGAVRLIVDIPAIVGDLTRE
jgi:chemotaxis signal transduction protein